MAGISYVSSTETSITVNIVNMDTTYNGAQRTVYYSLDGVLKGSRTLPNLSSSGGQFTFSGLSPGTWYVVSARITIATEAWEVNLVDEFQTDEAAVVLPDKWSWYASNSPQYEATAMQTRNAYYAVTGGGSVADFAYEVWNDLCYKVAEIREYVGSGWDTTYANFSNTLMTWSNRTLTARRFNSLR